MEIKAIDDKKNRYVFEAKGIGHTFLNMLKNGYLKKIVRRYVYLQEICV